MGIAIAGAQLLDGNGGPPLQDQAVLVEGDQITAIVPATDARSLVAPGYRCRGTNAFAGPHGLPCPHRRVLEAHHSREGDLVEAARDVFDVVTGLIALARTALCAIRDCGYPDHTIFAVREAAEAGLFPSPASSSAVVPYVPLEDMRPVLAFRSTVTDAMRRATRLRVQSWRRLDQADGHRRYRYP